MAELASLGGMGAKRDYIDLRDHIFAPRFDLLPSEYLPRDSLFTPATSGNLPFGLRNQGQRGNCVGQALANLIDIQMHMRMPPGAPQRRVSAAMLYQMAMFHDVADEEGQDGIRSLRSGIKAFFHHGVCPDGTEDDGWPDDDTVQRRRWPSEAQARAAQNVTLGAYSRIRPILHHYHCAIHEAGTVLVSARLHQGWASPQQGRIIPQEPKDELCHAVVIVGYNCEGFIVLNSWGEDWGGIPLGAEPDAPRARGMALWTYADWAKSIVDGWVLRLGVPGRDAFLVSAGPQGTERETETPGSTPYRMLQGNFVNLDAGCPQETGTYATPQAAIDSTVTGILDRLRGDSRGVVLSLPGVMETETQAFARVVRQKLKFESEGLDFLTCFWSANFAADLDAVLEDIFERCRKQAGAAVESLDRLFELSARGSGHAFWREIERHALCAALPGGADPGHAEPCAARRRGELGAIVERIADACAEQAKPLHILANGAGALVVDGLLERFRRRAVLSDPLSWVPALGSLVLTFPAVPLLQANERLLPLARAMAARGPDSGAAIIVPTPDLERRLTVHGYGRSILHLASRAFLERDGASTDQPMLGSYRAAEPDAPGSDLLVDPLAAHPDRVEPPFVPFGGFPAIRLEQHELDSSPDLEDRILRTIRQAPPPYPAARTPRPAFPTEDSIMTSQEIPTITMSELQQKISEGTLDPEAARYYFRLDEAASTPFSPVYLPNPDYVIMPGADSRSALALNSANTLARWSRLAAYYSKIGHGYDGPRLAAEGDSWFQYPVRLFDVIDYVAERYAVFDSSAAGDLLENMARQREYIDALRQSGADILLLSAGGNDVCAGGALADHLEDFDPALQPADYLKRGYQDLLDSAIAFYERICRDVNGHFPGVTIITHGYDYVVPSGGRWLGRPMESRGITDRGLQKRIAAEMIDQFNRALRRMAATMSHVAYVDCRNAVPANQWFDELHPTNAGFAPVAARILTKVKEITESRRERELMVNRVVPGGRQQASPQLVPQSLAGSRNLARSLHLGLNEIDPGHYAGDSGYLRGCENDARAMRDLAEAQGYATTTLLSREATRDAVIEELRRAARDLRAGDQFLFTNASHGSQLADFNGDEGEIGNRNPDSTICLYDGQMIDDELWSLFSQFQSGVRIVMISDSCHSGTIARAQRMGFDPTSLASVGALDNPAALAAMAVRADPGLLPRRLRDATASAVQDLHRDFYADLSRQYRHVDRQVLASPVRPVLAASLLQFSACRDDQVAMDGEEHGVFTAALLNVWDRGGFGGSYRQFHDRIVDALATMEQKPALFTPAPIDPAFLRQRPFTLVGAELNRETEGMMRPAEATSPAAPEEDRTEATESIATLDGTEGAEDPGEALAATSRASAPGIPAATMQRFSSFIAPLGLRHFAAEEFLALGAGHFGGGAAHGLNSAPPEQLWPNILPTAQVLDQLRARLGVPVTINSAYRNAAYNQAIGGEPHSWHMQFRACDISADGASARKVADTLSEMRGEGLFRGGIGRYAGFTHVDTRGVNADWSGAGRGLDAGQNAGATTASRRLREFAQSIPVDPKQGGRSRSTGPGDLADADAAVNGAQIMALDRKLSPELRKAVLYSTQFAQRAANAAADPVEDHDTWWQTLNSALGAVGWSVQQSTYRRASNSDQDATLDSLAIDAIAALTSVAGKLNAIRAVLDALRGAAAGDKRLKLLDLHMSEKASGAFQIGETELGENDEVLMSIGAVQFRSLDTRKGVLFAQWGKSVDSVGIAAERMIFNHDFYENMARSVVEQRLTDAQSQILAFKLERQPS
ncbi:caspase family protein [Paracoccus sp. KR1-242]|uniref:caspase family protein n=1 Tax=Paracoccus sp. KR1-242 TaxID=3410028 RepID=UPI003C0B060C